MTQTNRKFETLKVTFGDIAAHVVLNRPHARNAMNIQMVSELHTLFTSLRENRNVRAILLSGAGGTFCAGGDIKEMRTTAMPATEQAGNLDAMLRAVNQAPQVVIARVEGAALGGGLGLVSVTDIAIASETAKFGLPEVRLGLAPAFISPFIIQRIGLTRARELMLTGRRFNGRAALAYGFVHEAVPQDELDLSIEVVMDAIREAAPQAIAAIKDLLFTVKDQALDDSVAYRAVLLNHLRASDEGQEGLTAWQEKRPPRWAQRG